MKLTKKLLTALIVSLGLYFLKDILEGVFNNLEVLHITFITMISVCFKELVIFFYEYLEDYFQWKLKDTDSDVYIRRPVETTFSKLEDNPDVVEGRKIDFPSVLTKDNNELSGSNGSSNNNKSDDESNNKSLLDDPGNYGDEEYASDEDPVLKRVLEESKKDSGNKDSKFSHTESGESSKSYIPGKGVSADFLDVNTFKNIVSQNKDIPSLEAVKKQLEDFIKLTNETTNLPKHIRDNKISQYIEKIQSCDERLVELKNVKGKTKGFN